MTETKSEQSTKPLTMAKLSIKRNDSPSEPCKDLDTSSEVLKKRHSTSDLTEFSMEQIESDGSNDLCAQHQSSLLLHRPDIHTLGGSEEFSCVPNEQGQLPALDLPKRAISECLLPSEMSRLELGRAERAANKKSVSWANIEFKHHAVVLGDNPSVSSGPPVALGPELLHIDSIPVSDYEASRPPRREKFQMALPRMTREDMLKNHGYGRADFRHAEQQINKIKKNRKASASATLWEKLRHATTHPSSRFVNKLKSLNLDDPLA